MAKTAYNLPTGYDGEDSFLLEARERYQTGIDADRENREAGIEDQKFFAGEQWDADAVKSRKGRPTLTINTLPQFVAQIVGDIRINRPSIKVRPAEDADKDLADVREGLIRAIERSSDAQGVYSSAGQDQVVCGIGNFRMNLEYAADDAFDQDIVLRRIADPFAVVWDPLILDPTGKDAKWLFVEDAMPRKEFERLYPDETPTDLEAKSGWMTTDSVKITEYWVRKQTAVELALLEDGRIVEITKANDAFVRPTALKVRKGQRTSWCMYLINGHSILEKPYELKVSRPPIFRVPGWEATIEGKKYRWGLVRFAKDPARLRNYWRSVAAEVLAMQPRATWLIKTGAGGMEPEDADDFRDNAKNGDPVLEWQGQDAPSRVDPPAFPAALTQEANLNAQDIKDVTGIHDASLGAKSNETSGKAIIARQKEGDVASYIYHDNLQAAIREAGDVANQLIPVGYDTARTIRIVGEDEATKVMRVNDPNDPESVDLAKGKYDIVVETGPSYSTKRAEAAESMMQFVQAVPTAAQAAGDLIAKVQDWPMADKIGERLKKMLPPGMADEDDEEMTPEKMQAKQAMMQQAQQQQQMQQQMAQLELAEKEAQVAKLEAEALKIARPEPTKETDQPTNLDVALKMAEIRKAEADADKAEAEAAKARFEVPALLATTEANALKAQISVESDAMDLERKPLEAAHSEADLDLKLNPPKDDGAA